MFEKTKRFRSIIYFCIIYLINNSSHLLCHWQALDFLSKCVIDSTIDPVAVKSTLEKCMSTFSDSKLVQEKCSHLLSELSASLSYDASLLVSSVGSGVESSCAPQLSDELVTVCVTYAQQAAVAAVQSQIDAGAPMDLLCCSSNRLILNALFVLRRADFYRGSAGSTSELLRVLLPVLRAVLRRPNA